LFVKGVTVEVILDWSLFFHLNLWWLFLVELWNNIILIIGVVTDLEKVGPDLLIVV